MGKQVVYYLVQGDTLTTGWKLTTGATYATSTAVDLTGCSALVQFRPNVADVDGTATPLIQLSTADGTLLPLTTDGKIVPVFSDKSAATGTGNPALADAVLDVQITFTNGRVKTYPPAQFPRIKVEFANDVTRAA